MEIVRASLIVLIVIVCVFLALFVLVQNSKGGGLAANFSSSNQIMGVRKTADFLEKATWTLAGTLALLCLIVAFLIPRNRDANNNTSILGPEIENVADPTSIPLFPSNAPAATPENATPTNTPQGN